MLATAGVVLAVVARLAGLGSAGNRQQGGRPFSALEFAELKNVLHTLPIEAAEARFREVEPLAQPPPRQSRVDNVVVLFMENRAYDHVLGCLTGSIPNGGKKIPKDPRNATACASCHASSGCAGCGGFVNVSCGEAELVCHGGGGFSSWSPHFKTGAEASLYPYGEQAVGYGIPSQ